MTDPDDDIRAITAWLTANVGGDVVRISRQPRWRPVWFADVERDGEVLELCIRGDRTDMPLIFPLDHEMRLQSIMHDHGIPTAEGLRLDRRADGLRDGHACRGATTSSSPPTPSATR